MSDDRELLELAARAAGIEVTDSMRALWGFDGSSAWNPLTDDGDAFRLAVKLNMAVTIDFDRPILQVVVGCNGPADSDGACAVERGEDRVAATRRAIVRAAAEIGRQITD